MHTPEEYMARQSETERNMLLALHHFILTYGHLVSKTSYGLPFYYGKRWICYLGVMKNGGVELAFTRACELETTKHLLDFRDRKLVGSMYFSGIKDIRWEEVDLVLRSALDLDRLPKLAGKRNNK